MVSLLFGIVIVFGTTGELRSQGYIVPNGVVYAGSNNGVPYEVDVMYDPNHLFYTGFALHPNGTAPPSPYPNLFQFDPIIDVGVRVFLVSANDEISLQPVLAHSYPELLFPNTYEFVSGTPFYVGLFTGNMQYPPPDGIYNDPLFGWAELVNNRGVLEMLDSAMVYKAAGIYAGTQIIIPAVPEPSAVALSVLGVLLLGWRVLWRRR